MRSDSKIPQTIDEYIVAFPKDVQKILERIRRVVRKAAPEAKEAIKYGLATFTLNGNLIHFGAFKNHIGLYPTPKGIEEFKEELAAYEGGKGTVRFPLGEPIPYDLIRRIAEFRVKNQSEKVRRTKR